MLRLLLLLVAVVLVAAGGLGMGLAHAEDHPLVARAESSFVDAYGSLARGRDGWPSPGRLAGVLAGPARFGLLPVGLILLAAALLPGRSRSGSEGDDLDWENPEEVGRRERRRTLKEAASLARKGNALEAAEICLAIGLLDESASYFVDAGEFVRAAEIRHDQNRFVESAELYAKAGSFDSAAVIFAGQGEYERAAAAYVEIENFSVAAEMYEQAGKFLPAAECYDKAEFRLAAAEAYMKCEEWARAAAALDGAIFEQIAAVRGGDERARAEYTKLVKMAGYAHERAGSLEAAEVTLVKGEIFDAAAEMAHLRGDLERAAELFLQARNPTSAARALKSLGREEEADRVLAEHLRDRGDSLAAAEHFERGGDLLEAGDLYRSMEAWEKAGLCYERYGELAQAAEMFVQAEEHERAAGCYERGRQFEEAAQCFGLLGDGLREAEMLEMAGHHLRAGEIHQEAGRVEQAVAAYQQVQGGHEHFIEAAARLGAIFRDQGQLALATTKLREALEGRDIDAETVGVAFCLGTVLELEQKVQEAAELFERVQAFDYTYQDAGARLERCRALADARAESGFVTARAQPNGGPNRYEIQSTLGRGGMGIVYKAHDTVLDRPVAFKILPESFKENPQALKNFLREAKSAAKLNHPNIVTVYDAGEQDGALLHRDGVRRRERRSRRSSSVGAARSRPPGHAPGGDPSVCEALAYAHDKKRRPSRHQDRERHVDPRQARRRSWTSASRRSIEEVRNHTTVVSGTPYYMSPEQTLGQERRSPHRHLLARASRSFELADGDGCRSPEGNIPYHHVHTPPPDVREPARQAFPRVRWLSSMAAVPREGCRRAALPVRPSEILAEARSESWSAETGTHPASKCVSGA